MRWDCAEDALNLLLDVNFWQQQPVGRTRARAAHPHPE